MIFDSSVHTVADPAGWRALFGVPSLADHQAVVDRVAALESALDQLDARLSAFEAAVVARLDMVEGANRVRYVYCPGDQRTYMVWMDLVDGEPDLNWAVSPLQIQIVDGQPTLADVPADAATGTFDRLYAPDLIAYDLSAITVEGTLTLDWTTA